MLKVRLAVVVAAGLLGVGCQMTADNSLTIHADGGGTLVSSIEYDAAARDVLGGPDSFLTDVVEANVAFLDDVRISDAATDASDPARSRLSFTAEADGPQGLDELLAEAFVGAFAARDDGSFEVLLVVDSWRDGEALGLRPDLRGMTTVVAEGAITDVVGGQRLADDRVSWDQFGTDDLELVVELADAGPFSAISGRAGWWLPAGVLALVGAGAVGLTVARRR